MNPRSFLRSTKWAISLGAVVGTTLFGFAGRKLFGFTGMVGGSLLGAVFGAVSGLDLLLPSRRRHARDPGPGIGSFGVAMTCISVGLTAALYGCYVVGSLSLLCTRDGVTVRCSRIATGWFGTAETGRQDVGPIEGVQEGTPGQMVVTTDGGERQFIEGFDASALTELKGFIGSTRSTMTVKTRHLSLYAPLLWGISLAATIFGIFSLRKGISLLRRQLGNSTPHKD
jgi:hypothetical protein